MLVEGLMVKILMLCMYGIEPQFDKKVCVRSMISCTKYTSFDNCSDYWEPIDWEDDKWYYGDPKEADRSY
jgi:hypothetical protein